MNYLKTKLRAIECPFTREIGLWDERMPLYDHTVLDTGTGGLLAHDYIDHINGIEAIGTVIDELEAIGCAWAYRGPDYGADLTYQGCADDIISCFVYGYNKKLPFTPTPNHINDECFNSILDKAAINAFYEVEEATNDQWNHFRKVALAHMRIGARKLFRKYGPTIAQAQAYENFHAIQEAVKNLTIYENAIYQLTLKNGICRIEEKDYPYA